MEIKLKELSLQNFKGIRDFKITPNGDNISLFGANGTGKTSLFDAFTWLLFDKDSSDSKNFEIKTLDENGKPIHGLEHIVEGVFLVDGKELTLKKTYLEKWVKKTGEIEKTLQGHTVKYHIDDTPSKKKEYDDKINSLVKEDTFKLITNVLYFSSLHWEEQRKIVMEVCGDVEDTEILLADDELIELASAKGDRTVENFKKIVSEKLNLLGKEKEMIPVRIDEATKSMPTLDGEVDYDAIKANRDELKSQLKTINEKLLDAKSHQNKHSDMQTEFFNLKDSLLSIERDIDKKAASANPSVALEREVNKLEDEIEYKRKSIETKTKRVNALKNEKPSLEKKIEQVRAEWATEREKTFQMPDGEDTCPYCKQDLPEDMKEGKFEKLKAGFEKKKMQIKERLTNEGKKAKEELAKIDIDIKEEEEKINSLHREISALEPQLVDKKAELEKAKNTPLAAPDYTEDNKWKEVKGAMDKLQENIENFTESETSGLLEEKEIIEQQIQDASEILNSKDIIAKTKARIAELAAKEKEVSEQILLYEKYKYLIGQFTKAKVNYTQKAVDGKFKIAKFKMFDELVNGSIKDTCEVLVNTNGKLVPFSSANTAGKYNVGLDIINTLTEHYGVSAPIFIDNKESVTKLIPTKSQVIGLVVSEKHKKLTEGEI